jgi:3-hydroxyacyl-[acyl-carrier-protein] dehydratase
MMSEETLGAADIHDILRQLGYFPNDPVMLGVLTACVFVQRVLPPPAPDKRRAIFMTTDKAKFRKPARPGDTVAYHVDKVSRRRNMWWYRAESKVGDLLIAEAESRRLYVRGIT